MYVRSNLYLHIRIYLSALYNRLFDVDTACYATTPTVVLIVVSKEKKTSSKMRHTFLVDVKVRAFGAKKQQINTYACLDFIVAY